MSKNLTAFFAAMPRDTYVGLCVWITLVFGDNIWPPYSGMS